MLQPFLKRLPRRPHAAEQDQLRPTATLGEATSKLEEAVALVNTLGCEVVFKEVIKTGKGVLASSWVSSADL